MRIIQFVESAAAGTGRHVLDLTQGLVTRGHLVHLVYSPLRADARFRGRVSEFKSLPGFTCRELEIEHGLSPTDLASILRFRREVRRHKDLDVVHCHSTKAGFIGRLALALDPVPIVYTPNAFYSMDATLPAYKRWMVERLESSLSRLTAAVIAVSQAEFEHARQIGLSARKLAVVLNGVKARPLGADDRRTSLRAELGIPPSAVCIGFLGRLVPQKGPSYLLAAFASVLGRTSSPLYLVMAGAGKLEPQLRSEACRLAIQDRVTWLGNCDGPQAMAAFDVFALPSLSESLPYVVLEAMLCGLPIVATPVAGVPTMVREGVNGFLVPAGNTGALAAALARLADDAALRDRMGEASLKAVRRFDLDEMIDHTVHVYESVIRRRCPPGAQIARRAASRAGSTLFP